MTVLSAEVRGASPRGERSVSKERRAFAPPPKGQGRATLADPGPAECPHCGSTDTVQVSEFGSTACKALYKCRDCLEPFDYFKCL